MKKRISGAKLGRKKSHREALIRNQMRSLFSRGFITTTTPKAKALKGVAESFLSKIKGDTLATKRVMYSVLGNDKELVQKASEYSQKTENKVSIVKIGFRDGDNGETSKITLLGHEELFGKKKAGRKSSKADSKKKGETEYVEEKKSDKVSEKDKAGKGVLNIKDKIVNKERARSRSGI